LCIQCEHHPAHFHAKSPNTEDSLSDNKSKKWIIDELGVAGVCVFWQKIRILENFIDV